MLFLPRAGTVFCTNPRGRIARSRFRDGQER